MQKRSLILLIGLLFGMVLAVPASAQEPVVDGLWNPRGITFDMDGNLYVVEAGVGGDITAEGPFGPTDAGGTGRVTWVSPTGERKVIINNLPSMTFGNEYGAQAIQITNESIWLLLGEAPKSFPFSNGLVELDRANFRIKTFVDLYSIEIAEDPDGNPDGASNPTDFAIAADGTFYIANASCNCLQSWTREGGVSIAAAWEYASDNPVPVGVAVGPDGDIYVSFLTGFPFPTGGSRVERWSGGALKETYSGLTAVVDVFVAADGTVYAVQYGTFDSASGWTPASGSVVMVSAEGITPVLEGLTLPWGLAQDTNGNLFVSVGASGTTDGRVLPVPKP